MVSDFSNFHMHPYCGCLIYDELVIGLIVNGFNQTVDDQRKQNQGSIMYLAESV